MILLLAAVLGSSTALQSAPEDVMRKYQEDRLAALVRKTADRRSSDLDRYQALVELEHVKFDAAAELAPALLNENGTVRFLAAWILAQVGDARGAQALRDLAKDPGQPITFAMQALGRLQDREGHALLRRLLEQELPNWKTPGSRGRIAALFQSISEYQDDRDADLLAKAFSDQALSDWVSVDHLGRTGGSAAVLPLREVFLKSGRGWAVMSAGLALARCGDARGVRYVEEQLASAEPPVAQDRHATDGYKDDPNGPKAKYFLLDRMGAQRDVLFLPHLLAIAGDSEQHEYGRTLAWRALVRLHPRNDDLLRLAWENGSFEGASRIIALDDEANARAFIARVKAGGTRSEQYAGSRIEAALSTPSRERRVWREPFGYGF